jgi:hypothetical protein
MTDSIHVQAAAAIVTHVGDQVVGVGVNQTVIAERAYAARYDAEALSTDGTARVTVVPTGMRTWRDGDGGKHKGTRKRVATEWCLDVALHRFTTSDAENDSMMRLCEEVDELFRNQRLTGLTDLSWTESEYVITFDPKNLDDNAIFLSVMQFKFGGFR